MKQEINPCNFAYGAINLCGISFQKFQLVAQDMLYKPEYNLSGIQDWLSGRSYPLDAIKRLSVK